MPRRPGLAGVLGGAIAGELVAVDNCCEMVPLIGDTELKLRTLERAGIQSLHVGLLTGLHRSVGGGDVEAAVADPRWRRLRRDFSAAAARSDLTACRIIQDLMLATMGVVLYRALGGDPVAAPVAERLLGDETTHRDQGIAHVRALLRRDSKAVHHALAWANRRAMPALVSMVSAGCHALGAEPPLPGDAAAEGDDDDDDPRVAAEIEGLRADVLDAYRDTLDRAGFDGESTLPLIASLACDETLPLLHRRLRVDAAPAAFGGSVA